MQLENHISSLLKQHNCVIVPEFGGFIANYESAWINASRGIIYPPHKQVLFNANLIQNDGLLANELVQAMMISYADALAKISAEVKYWRKHLEAGDRIELNEIGFLFLQNGQIVFEQNREVKLLLQAYGLKQVNFVPYGTIAKEITTSVVTPKKPIVAKSSKPTTTQPTTSVAKEKAKTKKATLVISLNTEEPIEHLHEARDNQVISITQPKKSRNYKYAVAAAVILPVMFYAYWIPMKTDFLNTGKVQVSDFNPFNEPANATYQKRDSVFTMDLSSDWRSWEELTGTLPAHVAVYNLELTEELYIPVQLEGVEPDAGIFNADGAFHIVAGCFSVEANANNYVSQLVEKGYVAGVVDQNKGLFRVSAGSFNSESEAESALDTFEKDGFSGWILKK
jgi:cell division protein FtsN